MEKKTFAAELQTEENKPLFDYIAELESEIDVVEDVNKELSEKIEELSKAAPATLGEAGEKAQAAAKPVLPVETFEVDGTKYKFTTPVFVLNGSKSAGISSY
jgi:uncharacterized ParB-like nuclease family protein